MTKFTAREKMGKKARKALDREKRVTWAFCPVTRKTGSKKVYSRKKRAHDRDDDGMGCFFA